MTQVEFFQVELHTVFCKRDILEHADFCIKLEANQIFGRVKTLSLITSNFYRKPMMTLN